MKKKTPPDIHPSVPNFNTHTHCHIVAQLKLRMSIEGEFLATEIKKKFLLVRTPVNMYKSFKCECGVYSA